MNQAVDFIVKKEDLLQTAFVPGRDSAESAPADGQLLLQIKRFAFTANNVTYAVVGKKIGYWSFFPAKEGWGRIPVWGFADVAQSKHADFKPGERIYGYFPISDYLIVQAGSVSPGGFVDAMPHRAPLPPIYNQYARVAADPDYHPAKEALIALFKPLFTTAFLLHDFLTDRAFFDAKVVIVSSASSKTALGLAFLLSQAEGGRTIVGLTSSEHTAFVERTGYYDRVLTYDSLDSLMQGSSAVFVDFTGNARLVNDVHTRFGDNLKYSCQVGATHWDRVAPAGHLPGPAPALFFAPAQAQKRVGDWGVMELRKRVGGQTRSFLETASWLRIVEGQGRPAVERVYRDALQGKIDPSEGHFLSL